ncbi:hypothetical protein PA6761_02445 [Pseudomonas aeruginosa]
MNYLISLGIGLLVGALYAVLDFRSPAPPAIALVGLLGMQLGEQLPPWPRPAAAVAALIAATTRSPR